MQLKLPITHVKKNHNLFILDLTNSNKIIQLSNLIVKI